MSYRTWLETTSYMQEQVRCFDAPNPDDAVKGVWGVECLACGRAEYYRHAGEMTHEQATALTMHLRSHEEEPPERDNDYVPSKPRRRHRLDDEQARTIAAIRERPNFW